jgi:hypothetical protein
MENPPMAEDGRRGRRPRVRRRLGLSLAIRVASVATGGAGGGYLVATARFSHLGGLVHLSLPRDALYLLIITAGIAAVVLGWRVIVYLERRDQHHREIILGMRDQEGVYQKYEGSSSTYVRWPMSGDTQSEQSPRRPRRSRLPQSEKTGHGDVVPLDRHQQVRSEGGIADPGPGRPGAACEDGPQVVRALNGPQPTGPQLPPRPGARRARSRRRP